MSDISETVGLIDIFRFTVSQDDLKLVEKGNQITCLDLSSKLIDERITEANEEKPWEKIEQILFARLMIDDYSTVKQVSVNLPEDKSSNEFNPSDSQILRYLYGCFYRLQKVPKMNKAETLIINQAVLYLTEPDLFPDSGKRTKDGKKVPVLLNLITHYFRDPSHTEIIQKFVNSLGDMCKTNGETGYKEIIDPSYERLSLRFVKLAIDDSSLRDSINLVSVFLQQSDLASYLLMKNTPQRDNSITYQLTLLGYMISVSHLPRASLNGLTFFANPTQMIESDHKFTENQIGIKLTQLGQDLHKIFHALLKLPQTRNMFLSWMGRCLHTFKDRKKLWNNHLLMTGATTISSSDGFLMNFLTVMLHLSEPFAGPYNGQTVDKKMLRINPQYCRWSRVSHEKSQVHFLGLSEETFLVNSEESSLSGNQEFQPNFISECFYGAHQAFTYGFRSVYERFFKLAQNISELQHAYADASAHPLPSSFTGPDPREMIKEKINSSMSQFFNLKAVLMVPDRINMQMHFCIATASFLNHLVACENYDEVVNAKEFKKITMNTLEEKKLCKKNLEYIPEMLVENILDFFIFLKHFNEQALVQASDKLEPVMTLMITFMGNSSLMQNPHLRARFAEILECLMPHQSHHENSIIGCGQLFEDHPLVNGLAPSLVNVFVTIEMTGEGVQFEQKFSYRRPMYVVLEYLWGRPLHRKILIKLSQEAEANMDSARPPLFLRFINLLINDAIFLLDEALNYMNQLKGAESRRKTDEWRNLTPQVRAQEDANYSHVGRLARFHNSLSLSTIGTLSWLTTEIKAIFCHAALVDRVANMLNYFLEHLVGPKKGKFNVNDKNDYEFKPKEILEKICQIYINLGHQTSFCSAVSSDGRSYSQNLLPQATSILFRTGMSFLGTEFEKLSAKIQQIAVRNQLNEIQTEDIPDTFLDPIMSTLMLDPVLLPSSKIVVDRSTISRHLLSDQTDPFNRSPLSMEDIIPATDLKNQIEEFLKEKREARRG